MTHNNATTLEVVVDAPKAAAANEVIDSMEAVTTDINPTVWNGDWDQVPSDTDVAVVVVPSDNADRFQHVREWHQERPETPILVISPQATAAQAGLLLGLGANGVISKDNSLTTLQDGIETTANGDLFADDKLTPELVDQAARLADFLPENAPPITTAEWNAVSLLAIGESTAKGSEILGIKRRTYRLYVNRAKNKLGVDSNAELIRKTRECLDPSSAD